MPAVKMLRTDLPQAHNMRHPGPLNPSRLDFIEIPEVITEHVVLPIGKTLHDAIIEAARAFGGVCGTASINGGAFSAARFTTGGPEREGKSANYTYIRDIIDAKILMGTCSFGLAEDAPHFVHCHARLDSGDKYTDMGGHFFSPDCVISEPISAQINVFIGATITKKASSETLHAIFEVDQQPPIAESDLGGREFFIRVHPNEDLVIALESFCREHGIENALVSASLGSLNAPALSMRGTIQKVSSLGTEAISFMGDILTDEQGALSASLLTNIVDEAGTEFCGYLVKGHCPVCITAEIYMLEVLNSDLIENLSNDRKFAY